MNIQVLAPSNRFPKPGKPPHATNTTKLIPMAGMLLSHVDFATPLGCNPAAQAVFDPFLLNSLALGNESGHDMHTCHAGNAFWG